MVEDVMVEDVMVGGGWWKGVMVEGCDDGRV